MQPTDDSALLRQFVENHSDEAFAALVTRHVNLVYSVALRYVGNSHQAEEITQAVFIVLAKKAASLRHDKALSSWLFQATRLTANNFIRSEMRRHHREQEAYMQSILSESTESHVWQQIAPFIDTAVAALNEKDRRAIVLRFYEGRNLNEVGAALGSSEEAAKMRVNRAVEKLQKFFKKRGIDSTTAAITGAISANSVQVAPALLAKTATAVALAKGATVPSSVVALAKATLLAMKMKTIVATTATIVFVAGISAWFGFSSGTKTSSPPAHPTDSVPMNFANGAFTPDGNRDGTFLVEVDPDTLRTNNSAPVIHIKGPITTDSSNNLVAANGTYKKTDNSSSTKYLVTDSSVLYGKHIRVTFWLKTRDVKGWAGTFVIILGIDGRHWQYDDMSDRPVRGTTDWQQYEIVTDLPNEPCIIYFGPDLYGPGELWADDFQIDLAPHDVSSTDDRNWRISNESDPAVYSADTDFKVTHNGHPTLCFAYTPDGIAPRGTYTRLGHDFYGPDSDKYAGHTVRMSGWIKTENVSGHIEPVIFPYAGWYKLLARDSMVKDNSLKGTRDWTQFSVTCAIPENTEYLHTGFNFFGSGKVWIDLDSIKYEIIK